MLYKILTKNELLFIGFFGAMGMAKNDAIILAKPISALLIMAGVLFWIIKMLTDTYTTNERIWQLLLLGVGCLAAYFNHHLGPVLVILVITGLKNVRFKVVLSVMLGIQVTAFLIHGSIFVAALLAGRGINGYYETRRVMGLWDISRQYRIFFGELHPNGTQKLIGISSVIWSCLNYEKLCMKHVAILTCINTAFYFITYSNTGLLLWLLFAVMIWLLKREYAWIEQAAKASPYLFLLMTILVLGITYFYSSENILMEFLNKCVTGRFRWNHDHFWATGLSLWGKSLEAEVVYSGLDCGYINLLLCYGIVLFVIYILGTFFTLRHLAVKKMYPEIALVWFFQLFFIIESFIMVIWMNAAILYMSSLLYDIHFLKKLPGN